MFDSLRTPLAVVGRILLALMFVLSGVDKLLHTEGATAFMASGGLPAVPALTMLVGLVELLCGLAVATGFYARWAALALALFTLLASLIFHRYWSSPADQQIIQQLLFMKNMGVAGGMFIVAALGPGPGTVGKAAWNAPRSDRLLRTNGKPLPQSSANINLTVFKAFT